ncbi:MAG: Gfo/Idh/MocA family oxidoreductase [Pirellulaceae bacterium]
MLVTPEQEKIGRDNFHEAVGYTRRGFMQGAAAAAAAGGMGAAYFGYEKLTGADRVKVAFIGTGDEGNVLITEHPEDYMEVVAIADLRPANIKRTFAGSHPVARIGLNAKLGPDTAKNVEAFDDHRKLLEAKDRLGLEAVIIAVPLNQHAPIAIECMKAGLHVLTEKLMARTVAQCKEMIRVARENNVLLAVGHQRHYSVLYENANHLVKENLLGDIKFIRAQWHRNNSFPGRDQWRKWEKAAGEDKKALEALEASGQLQELGYDTARQLIDWRLYNKTGGGLMAELGSHQMDACSIFLGKQHPISVQGFGGKSFYGIEGVGDKSFWDDDREIDDQIFVTMEFPGKTYYADESRTKVQNERDICIVTYSSINTNRWEPYGESVFGTRGTLVMKTEKEALLYKEATADSGGGLDQRLWVIESAKGGGPVLDAYETSAPTKAANVVGLEQKISRGYREEMEHFAYCIRNGEPNEKLRCNGVVAMADAIMAMTANLAMEHKVRIEYKDEWFDPESDATPEAEFENKV